MADTLNIKGREHSRNNWSTTVDFPAPDGPEIIISLPGRCSLSTVSFILSAKEVGLKRLRGGRCTASSAPLGSPSIVEGLLHVLYQLSHLLDPGLDRDDLVRDRRVIGLGTNRVCFSE